MTSKPTKVDDNIDSDPYSEISEQRPSSVVMRKKSWTGSRSSSDAYESVNPRSVYSTLRQNQPSPVCDPEQPDDVYDDVTSTIPRPYAQVKRDYVAQALLSHDNGNNDGVYDDVGFKPFDPNFIPLPKPRIDEAAFEKVRLFLEENRDENEVYPDPDPSELGGNSMQILINFINEDTLQRMKEKEGNYYEDDLHPYEAI